MSQNEFTLILPSNSSMKYFPNNTTTNFSTHLPREVELSGRWEVGISEIHIPCNILHVSKEDAILSGLEDDKLFFPHGNYDSVERLVEAINKTWQEASKSYKCRKLFYDKKGGFVSFGFVRSEDGRIKSCKPFWLSTSVSRILGRFDYVKEDIIKDNYKITAFGKQPASLSRAIPDQFFIYSNLCEPRMVGDTFAQLLRIVSIDHKNLHFGSTIVKRFAPISYIPLLTNRFQTIDIDISDQFGKFEYGTLTVVLHFRRAF